MGIKKIVLFIILLLFIGSSCSQYVKKSELEEYVASQIEDQIIDYTDLASETAASVKWRNALTGGGDALDGIADSGIADGDVCFVLIMDSTTAKFYIFVFDNDSALSEDSPQVITPDDAGGNGRWVLAQIHYTAMVGEVDDGDVYINFSNSSAATYSSPSAGDCYYKRDDNDIYCYDGSGWNYLSFD